MNKVFISIFLLFAFCCEMLAQESHYQRAMRSEKDNEKYGVVGSPNVTSGGLTAGIYWSRHRNVDDVIIREETPADSIKRRAEFTRLCRLAYDAYESGDSYHTIVYGDSALRKHFHTPELYFFMAVSFDKLGDYKDAKYAYKQAVSAGYPNGQLAYKAFKARQKELKNKNKNKTK